ncbi:toxin Cry1Ac domain D-VI-related protein [Listeria grandensis]|uniref:toxin Cry1Ac domain D-VI-related protein n=1 Tax=Listeria grandensis TaxID=1494963 RepID=UPI00164D7E72
MDNAYHASIVEGTPYYSYLNGIIWRLASPVSGSSDFKLEITDQEGRDMGYLTKDELVPISDAQWVQHANYHLNHLIVLGVSTENTQEQIDDAQECVQYIYGNKKVKSELQAKVTEAQRQYNYNHSLTATVESIFTNSNHTELKSYVTQSDLDDLKDRVGGVVNVVWRDRLAYKLANAQSILAGAKNLQAAINAVDKLFGNCMHNTLAKGITATNINKAKALVNKVTNAAKKKALLDEIEKAEQLQNATTAEQIAEQATNNLFDKDGKLAEGTTQQDIDKAKEEVNKVTDNRRGGAGRRTQLEVIGLGALER